MKQIGIFNLLQGQMTSSDVLSINIISFVCILLYENYLLMSMKNFYYLLLWCVKCSYGMVNYVDPDQTDLGLNCLKAVRIFKVNTGSLKYCV